MRRGRDGGRDGDEKGYEKGDEKGDEKGTRRGGGVSAAGAAVPMGGRDETVTAAATMAAGR